MKASLGFPEGSSVFQAAISHDPRAENVFKILMVYTRALGVQVVLKDVMDHWPIEYRREVEVAIKDYLEECRSNAWSEKKK